MSKKLNSLIGRLGRQEDPANNLPEVSETTEPSQGFLSQLNEVIPAWAQRTAAMGLVVFATSCKSIYPEVAQSAAGVVEDNNKRVADNFGLIPEHQRAEVAIKSLDSTAWAARGIAAGHKGGMVDTRDGERRSEVSGEGQPVRNNGDMSAFIQNGIQQSGARRVPNSQNLNRNSQFKVRTRKGYNDCGTSNTFANDPNLRLQQQESMQYQDRNWHYVNGEKVFY